MTCEGLNLKPRLAALIRAFHYYNSRPCLQLASTDVMSRRPKGLIVSANSGTLTLSSCAASALRTLSDDFIVGRNGPPSLHNSLASLICSAAARRVSDATCGSRAALQCCRRPL